MKQNLKPPSRTIRRRLHNRSSRSSGEFMMLDLANSRLVFLAVDATLARVMVVGGRLNLSYAKKADIPLRLHEDFCFPA